MAVLCFASFSPDYIFFQLLLEHIFFPTGMSFVVVVVVVVVVSRRAHTPGYVK